MESSSIPPADPSEPGRPASGAFWLAALLAASFGLLLIFSWVLFFSPTGQLGTTVVDFNQDLQAPSDWPRPDKPELRIAVASMVSPEDTFEVYGELIQYLGEKTGRKPRMVQRMTYREINDLILSGFIHLGFICTGPYLKALHAGRMEPLVIPVVNGKSYYRAYVIVPRRSSWASFNELRGKTFAFMDPDSLTGFLYPVSLLRKMGGAGPEEFFGDTFIVRSHTDLLHAVSYGLADGASVNSNVYDYYQKRRPREIEECRILTVSEPLGMPPVVTGPGMPDGLRRRIRDAFLGMDRDPLGKSILDKMGVDAFAPAETIRGLYEATWAMFFSSER
ncbi:MAG: PhnD/SsuA/transferrin family substrate-binding protein [bacterium]